VRRPLNSIVGALFLSALLGCSGSGSGGGGGGENNGGGNGGGNGPQNKEEALGKLTPVHKQSFERWQQQIVKRCDAAEAFGLNKDKKLEMEGVDGAALIKANGGSLVFSDNNSLLIITSYNSFSGLGKTKIDETEQVNGQGYTISAETKREGSACAVYLFGQKVFETYIAESFVVGTQWTPGKEAKSTWPTPEVSPLGATGASEATQTGLYKLISQTFKPTKDAVALLSKRLSLTDEQSVKLFRLSSYTSADSAVRIDKEASAIWSNQEGDNLIANGAVLRKLFDGSDRILPLEIRLAIPELSFSGVKNDKDGGNLKLIADILIAQKNTVFGYSTQSIVLVGLTPFDKSEAVSCAKDRAMAYVGGSPGENQIQPTVQAMFSPCRSLYAAIEEASYESGLLKSLIPQMFAGVIPTAKYRYGGWEDVLSNLALAGIGQGKDIGNELDPSGRTKVVAIVADHLESLEQGLSQTKNMTQSKDYVFRMGLDWSFKGQIVPSTRISQILQSVDNSIDTFKVSTEKLLGDLGRQPGSYDDQLAFAQAIEGAYKVEAMKALSLSKDLSYSEFEADVFNQVIQRKVIVDEFKDWSMKFSGIKSELGKYSNLGPVKGDLVGLSIKWLKSGETTLQNLGSVYSAIDNSILPFEESAKELVRSLSQSLLNNTVALDFARTLTAEYKQLANSIRSNSKAADLEDWGQSFFRSILQKRPSIEQLRAWNEMWSAALAFTQREMARTKDEFGSTNEWNRKRLVAVAAEENWSNDEFTGLESIAEVARAKNTCDRLKGYSSLADCGGMKLFSKKKGMFFDLALGNRYVNLGKDFAGYMSQLAGFDWTSLRWMLVGEFFGSFEPIWSRCDQNSFAQKASTLGAQVNAIVKEADQFKKWELERQIKDSARNCQYQNKNVYKIKPSELLKDF
jgi:hypothetical protein